MGAAFVLALWAQLFDKGHTWTYELSVTEFDYVEQKGGTYKAVPGKPTKSTFTCTVTDVVDTKDATESTITCDKTIDSNYGFRVDGAWVAAKTGISREIGQPALVPASPRVKRVKTKDDFGGFYVQAVTSPAKGTWCTVSDTTKTGAGDGGIETICFAKGAIVSGSFDYHGGTPRIVSYKLLR